MASGMDKLQKLLQEQKNIPVYYLASTEQSLLREGALAIRQHLEDKTAELTRIDGPTPNIGEVIAATGVISMFGDQRLVELREIAPSSMNEKDVNELAELFGELANSVLLVTALYKDKKAAGSKKSKKLFDTASKTGVSLELAKPTRKENIDYLQHCAAQLDTAFAHRGADALLDRAGDDRPLLYSEVQKLAAMSGYTTITEELVEKHGALNIEADVFALSRYITGGRRGAAFAKLEDLFSLRHEPIAITAALAGSFVDMLRVRVGLEKRYGVSTIFTDMGYTGSDYRLQKAKENSARYTINALENAVLCLADLDKALKSSALPDKRILVETAVAEIITLGGRR